MDGRIQIMQFLIRRILTYPLLSRTQRSKVSRRLREAG